MTGAALVVQGDALRLPLPDGSVDLVVTSPPFWNLRDYGVIGQIGNEASRQAFLDELWEVTRECMRVMKPTASLFVELGDSYSTRYSSQRGAGRAGLNGDDGSRGRSGQNRTGSPEKSLNLTPQRYVIGCVDNLGLILRAEIIWDRPNGVPESVKDRVRLSHSRWWHLVKQPKYYSATDEVREGYAPGTAARYASGYNVAGATRADGTYAHGPLRAIAAGEDKGPNSTNPLGKLPGSVWSIPSEPLRLPEHLGVQHYAAFPSEWPRRLILGWSPPGICLDCGTGRVPVVERASALDQDGKTCRRCGKDHGRTRHDPHPDRDGNQHMAGQLWSGQFACTEATILGYACSCTPYTDHPGTEGTRVKGTHPSNIQANPGGGVANYERHGPWREYHLDGWQAPLTRPAIILDPFGGTGTSAMVARALGRIGVSVDLSFPYCRAARWRVRHDGAKAISRTNLERQGSLL